MYEVSELNPGVYGVRLTGLKLKNNITSRYVAIFYGPECEEDAVVWAQLKNDARTPKVEPVPND